MFTPPTIQSVPPLMRHHGTHFLAYGLVWSMFDYAGRLIVKHSGGMPGYISKVTLIPEKKIKNGKTNSKNQTVFGFQKNPPAINRE